MKKIFIFAVFALVCMMYSCNEDYINTFEDDVQGIYFQTGSQQRLYINYDEYWDSTYYSFSTADEDVTEHVETARLRTLGKVKDYDRKVRVVVDAENTTAVEGVHYRIDFDTIMIHAGQSEVEVPVTMLRSADLKENKVRLKIKVEENDNFIVPFTTQNNTNVYYDDGEQIMADRYLFIFDEFYAEPKLWSWFGTEYLGAWSVSKQKLASKLFDLSAYDWSTEGWSNGDGKVQSARFVYFAIKMRIYLQEQADNGTPVLDDDGNYMQLGDEYQVDYSAYV